VCEPLSGPLPGEGRAHTHELPVVETMACLLHRGTFDHIGDTYNALIKWIETNGYRMTGPNREVYLRAVAYPKTDVEYPKDYLTDNEADRLTEVQLPVEKV
jgi:effector-binding domain-containing protein